jgi:acetyl-CoA C-acetyltransferase
MTDIIIAGAARTPVGAFNGGLASVSASDLGKISIQEALRRAGVAAKDVSEVIMGQILTAGTGQNPARQASIAAGLPVEVPAYGVNQLCGSGLKAVAINGGVLSFSSIQSVVPRVAPQGVVLGIAGEIQIGLAL